MEGILRAWHHCDRFIIRGTEVLLFGVGVTFTFLVTLEVISRFLFNFSIFFTNALARYLLVWFFLLGAGLALRKGAHVGFEFLVKSFPPEVSKKIAMVANVLVLAFLALMMWSGLTSLPQALSETDSSLGVSSVWVMFAFPVGFALLIYHQLSAILDRRLAVRKGGVQS